MIQSSLNDEGEIIGNTGNIADLHTHTSYSDGDHLPDEVVKMAGSKGIKILSITDHDTIDGLESARQECERHNITFIPGIEFTTETEYIGIEVHILGYNIDPADNELLNLTDHAKENARDYCKKVCSALESHGWEIDYSMIELTKGIITNHDITLAVKNRNMSTFDFHNTWLTENSALGIEMQRFSAKKVIKAIHSAGGKAICAHILRTLEQANKLPLLPYMSESLIRNGIDGFEVFYANSSEEQVRRMYELCSEQGLMMTGGSDFHGVGRTKRCQLGEYNTYSEFSHQKIAGVLYAGYNDYIAQKVIA